MTMMMKMAVATLALLMVPAFARASADPAASDVPQGASLSPPPAPIGTAAPPAEPAPSAGPGAVVPSAAVPPASPLDIATAEARSALAPAPNIEVLDQSLVSMMTDNATLTSTPTTSMPYVVGKSCYHWAVKYTPVEGEVTLIEELRLPGPARNWDYRGTETVVNPQGSGAITTRRFNGNTGGATAGWCVAKDDPMGSYRYIIRQGEREVARFDFTVGDLL